METTKQKPMADKQKVKSKESNHIRENPFTTKKGCQRGQKTMTYKITRKQ
jgi:hypothetical protein